MTKASDVEQEIRNNAEKSRKEGGGGDVDNAPISSNVKVKVPKLKLESTVQCIFAYFGRGLVHPGENMWLHSDKHSFIIKSCQNYTS